MRRLGEWVYDHRWRVVVAALLLALASLPTAARVFDVAKQGGFEDPSSEAAQVEEFLTKQGLGFAGIDDLFLIVTSPEEPLVAVPVAKEIDRLASVGLADPLVSRVVYRNEDLISMTLLGSDDEKRTHYEEVLEPQLRSETLDVIHGGLTPGNVELTETVVRDLRRAELIALPLTLLALWLLFGGIVPALLPIVTAVLSLLLAWGAIGILGRYVNISVLALTPMSMLALGVAVDYSLFVVMRYREEMSHQSENIRGAMGVTSGTAGRAVLVSGVTTAISLASLLMFNEMFLRSVAIGAFLAVGIGVLVATTVLPALIAILGQSAREPARAFTVSSGPRWLLRQAGLRFDDFARQPREQTEEGFWFRVSRLGARWPLPLVTLVVLVLLLAGTPFLRINLALPDERGLPSHFEARVALDRLESEFSDLERDTVDVLIEFDTDLARDRYRDVAAFVAAAEAVPGITGSDGLTQRHTFEEVNWQQLPVSERDDFLILNVEGVVNRFVEGNAIVTRLELAAPSRSAEALDVIDELRSVPGIEGASVRLGGASAALLDGRASLRARIPYVVAFIVAVTLLALFLEFRSIMIPIKAVFLNAVSISAALGALVWVFQDGHLEQILRFEETGSITTVAPVLIFAIVFGLSMDYEIFLLSRIREEYENNGGDTEQAVAQGLQRTGRMITGAALLIVLVVGAFATSEVVLMKQIGFGLAVAILLDATVVRALLVPASMHLMGRANWWAPRWLLPRRLPPESDR